LCAALARNPFALIVARMLAAHNHVCVMTGLRIETLTAGQWPII